MDPNIINNIGLSNGMSHKDLELITQLLGNSNGKNKAPKISAKDRNNLISKLSSNSTLNEVPQKELKDMSESEKQLYREELRKKIKNKQNEKKMLRTNNFGKNKETYDKAIEKLSDVIANTQNSTNVVQEHIPDIQTPDIQTSDIQTQNKESETKLLTIEKLEKINNLIDKKYNENNLSNTNESTNLENDELNDYIK